MARVVRVCVCGIRHMVGVVCVLVVFAGRLDLFCARVPVELVRWFELLDNIETQ
jgi:hypothetical protein